VGKLESVVRTSSGHALIVVEDAVRSATDAIYDLIETFQQTDVAVSVLLDARRGELEDFEDPTVMETGVSDALRDVLGNIERYDVPHWTQTTTVSVGVLLSGLRQRPDAK
jgi:hypothetical protein